MLAPGQHRNIALLFPGQGSQFPYMGTKIIETHIGREILQKADDILGYSLSKIMLDDSGPELNKTLYTQPAVFVYSMALYYLLNQSVSLEVTCAAGHSLGEYSALCAANVISFDDALRVIHVRAQSMHCAQEQGSCGMVAVMSPQRDEIMALIHDCRSFGILDAANFNSPEQIVVSGQLRAIEYLVESVKKIKRTKTVMLPVSSAFHTCLMDDAREALRIELDTVSVGKFQFPVIANSTAEPYPEEPEQVKRLLYEQVVHPVLWENSIHRIQATYGPDFFLEIGPGKVLTSLLKRIDKNSIGINISEGEETLKIPNILVNES